MVESSNTFGKLIAFDQTEVVKPFVIIFSGSFSPLHMNHIRMIIFTKNQLEKSYGYTVVGAFIIPNGDAPLRKKFNGSLPMK